MFVTAHRQGIGKYLPSDIDASLCTHIVYGFAVLDGDQLVIKPHDSWADIDNSKKRHILHLNALDQNQNNVRISLYSRLLRKGGCVQEEGR